MQLFMQKRRMLHGRRKREQCQAPFQPARTPYGRAGGGQALRHGNHDEHFVELPKNRNYATLLIDKKKHDTMPLRAESWSTTTSRETALAAASQPWLINFASDEAGEASRMRFCSSRENTHDWSTWYPAAKLDAKLESFLHYATTAKEPGIDIIACGSNAQHGKIALSEDYFYTIDERFAPISKIAFFEEKGQTGSYPIYEDSKPKELLIWLHSPTAFIHGVACCARINLQTKSTAIVYFDRNEERIRTILDYMESCPYDHVLAPFQFLVKLLNGYGQGGESWRLIIDERIRLMEGETGARSQTLELEPDKGHLNNFGRLTMSTQTSNQSLINLEHVTNWHIFAIEFLSEMWTLYINELLIRSKPLDQQRRQAIIYDLKNQGHECRLRLARVNGAQKRMQSQISILLSLISQRDNRVNIFVAHQSRELAAAATRDSRMMRVIAGLTLVFLPATLIATIFSSDVINLGDLGPDQPRVSPLWWVFALASGVSTLLVMIAGYLFLRFDTKSRNSHSKPYNPG